ncbi:hypothetical protein EVAR_74762_1 [Eumeta japonica]|uniref:Uncharacterized protein n=1 Tax=Eumeta variegata TaxID=151549 RepID=A0A4C1SS00_EUMVA|nr:hypothetical protein EVAR_74762_1 [Eumeta japonica]
MAIDSTTSRRSTARDSRVTCAPPSTGGGARVMAARRRGRAGGAGGAAYASEASGFCEASRPLALCRFPRNVRSTPHTYSKGRLY